jgi:hypothetical protein
VKALTLTAPWGTLVAFGEKKIETRSWGTRYRGPLAIHQAAGAAPVGGERGLRDLIETEPFASVLRACLSGYTAEERAADLPRGAVVAVTNLLAVVPTEGNLARTLDVHAGELRSLGLNPPGWISPHEDDFGDFSAGRYAWLLERRFNLYDGVRCRGALGLWTVPADVERELGPEST